MVEQQLICYSESGVHQVFDSPDQRYDDGTETGVYARVGCIEDVDGVVHDHGKPTELATHEHQEHEQDGFPVACVPADRTLIFK